MRKNTYSDKKAGVDDRGGKGAVNIESEFPPWFSKGCLPEKIPTEPTALSQYLNTCRQVIYSAASLYHDHIKYVTTIFVALLTAMVTIFSLLKIAEVDQSIVRIIELAGVGLMVVAVFVGIISQYIIMRYHMLYIATLLYATEVHHAAGVVSFRWFEDIIELLREKYTKNEEISREEFIRSRTWDCKYGYFWYFILITFLILVCFAAAILLGFYAPFSRCY